MKSRKKKSAPQKKPQPQPKAAPAPAITLSPGRKWLFRFISLVVMPVLLTLLAGAVLEICLRIGGYGFDTGFFRRIHAGGQDYFVNNEKFIYRFFPPQLARWPDAFKMSAVKPPDTVRIFIFGESAAMGDPQPAYGAGRYMEVLLRDRFPGKKFEVINLGVTAINSHVILPIARECAKHQGDYWIIYMGNNEMVGPFGAATVFGAQAAPRWAAQLNLAIQKTRTGQLLVSALRGLGVKSKNTSWAGMEMFLENQIAPNDPRKETVYRNFQANLRDIVAAGVGSGAKVILNTVSVNLKDCPPFASYRDTRPQAVDLERFDRLFADAKTEQAQGNFAAAAGDFSDAVKLEPLFAEAHYRLGQCELALTNAAAAAPEFQAACDRDALPFRADTRINTIIREALQRAPASLLFADADRVLAQAAPEGITGDETLFEHVHFNFDGNYRLGRLWAEQVGNQLTAAGVASAGTNWASQADCERDLALTVWNRDFVLQSVLRRFGTPPLSKQFNNEERADRVRTEDKRLREWQAKPEAVEEARAEYAAALKRAPDDSYLYEGEANFYEAIKDPVAATAAYRKLLELRPENFYACLQLGRMLGEQGKAQEGEPFLRQAVELRASLPEGWSELGNILALQSKYSEAQDCMERAAKLRPSDPSFLCYAGEMLAKLNRHTEAIEHFRRVIQQDPNYWEAHFDLAGQLVAINQPAEAMNEYVAVLKLNPAHAVSHINLGVLFVRFNRFDEAIQCFQNALKIEPDNRTAQEYLASVEAHKATQP